MLKHALPLSSSSSFRSFTLTYYYYTYSRLFWSRQDSREHKIQTLTLTHIFSHWAYHTAYGILLLFVISHFILFLFWYFLLYTQLINLHLLLSILPSLHSNPHTHFNVIRENWILYFLYFLLLFIFLQLLLLLLFLLVLTVDCEELLMFEKSATKTVQYETTCNINLHPLTKCDLKPEAARKKWSKRKWYSIILPLQRLLLLYTTTQILYSTTTTTSTSIQEIAYFLMKPESYFICHQSSFLIIKLNSFFLWGSVEDLVWRWSHPPACLKKPVCLNHQPQKLLRWCCCCRRLLKMVKDGHTATKSLPIADNMILFFRVLFILAEIVEKYVIPVNPFHSLFFDAERLYLATHNLFQ